MNTTLVIEVGNSWLKLALFSAVLGGQQLKSVAMLSGTVLSENAIAMAIVDFLKEAKVKKPQAITVSFSRSAVTLRNLRIPSVSPSEIDDMIKLHVGRQVPYAKEEIVSGYRVIGKDAMGYSKVMLAIIHRESIRKVFRILEQVGLYTDKVELSSDGILSWLSKADKIADLKKTEAFIILDIDTNFTDFLVSSNENILFSRVITQGCQHLIDESKWPKFIGEMKQTMVISQGEEVTQKPSRIYMTGAVEEFKKLAGAIEAEFNFPLQVVEPLSNIPTAKKFVRNPAELFQHGSMSSVLGLGMDPARKKINFVLPEAQIRKTLKERSRDMIFLGSGMMYLILIMCGIYLEKMHNRQSYLDLLGERYKKIEMKAEALDENMERIKRIKSKLNTESAAIDYLLEVSRLLPAEIVISSFSLKGGERLDLKGTAREMSDVPVFSTALERSAYFKEVQTRYSTRKKIGGKDIVEFDLVCPLEKGSQEKSKKKQ